MDKSGYPAYQQYTTIKAESYLKEEIEISGHIGMSEVLEDYIIQHTCESAVSKRLRMETAKLSHGGMMLARKIQYIAVN